MKKQVTIEEARKILGDDASGMDDEQIEELINHLSVMAKWALEESIRVHREDSQGQN